MRDAALRRELRRIYKSIDDLDRRQAATILAGPVAAIDGDRVRIELRPAEAGGRPFLSPWVQLQEAAGATATHFPVQLGDPMRLLSPNGEIGPQSLAIRDGYTSGAPAPTDRKQAELVLSFGGATIRLGGGRIDLQAGSIEHTSGELTHNGRNVGDTHLHTGVLPGGALTGPPGA